MPELPEVETVKRGLEKLIGSQKIVSVSHDWPKSFPNAQEDVNNFVVGARIIEVKRRAKVLLIELSSKYTLLIHLKMTGQLVFVANQQKQYRNPNIEILNGKESKKLEKANANENRFGGGHPTDSLIGILPDKSTRVVLELSRGKLFFNDQRKFGWMRLVPTLEVPNIDFMRKLGPEPLASDFTAKNFRERLDRRKNSMIKAALLDQSVIAGVGNIYADEGLWGAKIHPAAQVNKLNGRQIYLLFRELRFVLRLSIEKGGSTDKNYVDAEGKKGSYIKFARVFRREGQPCPRCGRVIIKTRVAGRGTHLCPNCQKEPK